MLVCLHGPSEPTNGSCILLVLQSSRQLCKKLRVCFKGELPTIKAILTPSNSPPNSVNFFSRTRRYYSLFVRQCE